MQRQTQKKSDSNPSPEIPMPLSIALFVREGCPHCDRARALLDERGWFYEEIPVAGAVTMDAVHAVSGRTTVPQIYLDGVHVGGADDLEAWLADPKKQAA